MLTKSITILMRNYIYFHLLQAFLSNLKRVKLYIDRKNSIDTVHDNLYNQALVPKSLP